MAGELKSKPLLVIFTTDTCPYCVDFKGKGGIDALYKWGQEKGLAYVFHVETTRGGIPPIFVKMALPHVPCFVLMNVDSLQTGSIISETFGAVMTKGEVLRDPKAEQATVANITKWAERKILTEPVMTAKFASMRGSSIVPKDSGSLFMIQKIF